MKINSLKNLPDREFPEGLHTRIMKKILFLKFRTVLLLTGGFLLVNLTVLIHGIFVHISQNQSLGILQQMLADFELSADYFSSFASMAKTVLPINLLLILLLNLALLYYVGLLVFEFKKIFNKPLANTAKA